MQHKQQSQLVTSLQATSIILLILQQGAFFCVQLENVNHFLSKISPCNLHLKKGKCAGNVRELVVSGQRTRFDTGLRQQERFP